MKNTIHSKSHEQVQQLLQDAGLCLRAEQHDQLQSYMALLRQWNPYVSLVSIPDLDHLYARHVVDALSLAPYVLESGPAPHLLDIGSGGGFPAIPLAIALPALRLTLLERSFKKTGFLRKAAGALQLRQVDLVHGEFPKDLPDIHPTVITARAVEKPEVLTPAILHYLPPTATFLCQSGQVQAIDPAMFHVEPINDAWQDQALRRGSLHRITRR